MKKIVLSLLVLLISLVSINVFAVQIENPLAGGGVNDFPGLLTKISTGVAGLVGTLSGIMIIIAGIMYLTSAGDPQKINLAKTALKYAIMGIVIALLAIPIVELIKSLIGAPTT